jgi:hypothetical protein
MRLCCLFVLFSFCDCWLVVLCFVGACFWCVLVESGGYLSFCLFELYVKFCPFLWVKVRNSKPVYNPFKLVKTQNS